MIRFAVLLAAMGSSIIHASLEQDPNNLPPMIEPGPAPASPLDSGCLALALNRSAQVNPDGTFLVNNVPSTLGLVRVRFVCARASGILGGQTGFLMPAAGDVVDAGNLSSIVLGVMPAIPTRLVVTTSDSTLTSAGQEAGIHVQGTLPGGATLDLTAASTGTVLTSSNEGVIRIVPGQVGVVAAVASGTVAITALNDGLVGTVLITAAISGDADGDGMPDDYESARGFNPQDPTDATADPDGDGLTNRMEFDRGTEPRIADTDGDGAGDGQEANGITNPLVADSDADGVLDGQEPAGNLDGDGLPNALDRDSDNDGLADGTEVRICGTIGCADPLGDADGDLLVNLDEGSLFTDVLAYDTDRDGLGDGEEILAGTDPLVPDRTPPTVALSAPAVAATLVRGDRITIGAAATDDGRVVQVDFFIDGVLVGTAGAPPYTVIARVPATAGGVGIEAAARDTNGNIGRSGVTVFGTVNDPLTTVTGLVVDDANLPVQGADVAVRVPQSMAETGTAEIEGGSFALDPTSHISSSTLAGAINFSAGSEPILDGLVDLEPAGLAFVSGTMAIDFTGFDPAHPTARPATLVITGTAAGGMSLTMSGPLNPIIPVTGTTVIETTLPVTAFDPDGFPSAQPLLGLPATVSLQGTLHLQVVAGTSTVTSAELNVSLRESIVLSLSTTTGPDGRFSVPRVPTIDGALVAEARHQPAGRILLKGSSAPVSPVRAGTTDVGTIHLGEPPPLALFPYPVFLVGRDPGSVTAADFNGDGIKDLAAANISSNDVTVLTGNGDGTFHPQGAALAAPFQPYSIVAVDLNRDGRTDLVTSNIGSNNVSVFLGNGNGTFQNSTPATRVQVSVGSTPISIAASDLDGDGLQDLVTADRDSNALSLLFGRGNGSFRPEVRLTVTGGPRALAIADFDGDGNQDIAVATAGGDDVAVLRGNGDGTFAAAARFPSGDGANAIASGDLNRDGRPDLAVANFSDNTVSLLIGNGNGTFAAPAARAVGVHPVGVAIADLSGGGIPDVVVVNQGTADLSILLGNGDGTVRPESRIAAVSLPSAVVAADVNGDAALDLAVTNQGDNNVQIVYGKGDGTFTAQRRFAVSTTGGGASSGPRSIGTADFNSDGKADLVVLEMENNRVALHLGDGNGAFQSATFFGVGSTPLELTVTDLNADGKPDVAVTNQNTDNVSILLGNGAGGFSSSSFALQGPAGGSPRPLAAADFNNDGKRDLAIGRSAGGIDLYLGSGTGTFMFSGRFATGFSSFLSLTAGDFNADGKKDLAFTNGGLAVMLGNGDGTMGSAAGVAAGTVAEWTVAGDFDSDGDDDLATANLFSNDVTIGRSNGNGAFQAPVSYLVGAGQSPLYVTTGDFNGDGRLDLAMTNGETQGRASDDVVALFGRGDGTFVAGPRLACGITPISIAPADFTSDGRQDMAILNRDSTSVSILVNQGP